MESSSPFQPMLFSSSVEKKLQPNADLLQSSCKITAPQNHCPLQSQSDSLAVSSVVYSLICSLIELHPEACLHRTPSLWLLFSVNKNTFSSYLFTARSCTVQQPVVRLYPATGGGPAATQAPKRTGRWSLQVGYQSSFCEYQQLQKLTLTFGLEVRQTHSMGFQS